MVEVYTMEELARYADEWEQASPRPEPDWERAFALAAAQLDDGEVVLIHRAKCPVDEFVDCTCKPFWIRKATA